MEENKPIKCEKCNEDGVIITDDKNYMRMPKSEWCDCEYGKMKYKEFLKRRRT